MIKKAKKAEKTITTLIHKKPVSSIESENKEPDFSITNPEIIPSSTPEESIMTGKNKSEIVRRAKKNIKAMKSFVLPESPFSCIK